MVNLSTLRRLARRAYGKQDTVVEQHDDVGGITNWWLDTQDLVIGHPDRATARAMLAAALRAAVPKRRKK